MKLHYLIATLALTTAGIVSAQTSDGSTARGPHRDGHRGPGGAGHPIVRALDVDKNGEISADEIKGAAAALAKLDTNSDGTISSEELHPRPAGAPTPPAGTAREGARSRPADLLMLALDANSDGALSASEISRAPMSLAVLDANSDGKLTRDELRPVPPAKN